MLGYAQKTLRQKKSWVACFGKHLKAAQDLTGGISSNARRLKLEVYAKINLVAKIRSCDIAFYHLGYRHDLDAVQTTESFASYLPSHLQRRWAEKWAASRGNREATFESRTDYIDRQATVPVVRFSPAARHGSRPMKPSPGQLQFTAKYNSRMQPR